MTVKPQQSRRDRFSTTAKFPPSANKHGRVESPLDALTVLLELMPP
ncbi:MAG TPA: hypothetical protein VIK01_10720 [Polyangiaceae bacterium]